MKRGQVTIFIIVAIVIIVAGAIISMLALFVAKKIRVYRIAKTKTKNEIIKLHGKKYSLMAIVERVK